MRALTRMDHATRLSTLANGLIPDQAPVHDAPVCPENLQRLGNRAFVPQLLEHAFKDMRVKRHVSKICHPLP